MFFFVTIPVTFSRKSFDSPKTRSNQKSLFGLTLNREGKNKKTISMEKTEGTSEEKPEEITKEESSDNSIFSFIKEVAEETRMVEWPSLERLFKQFVIVVISLVLSAFVIYSVDGFFASLSQFLFEGKS